MKTEKDLFRLGHIKDCTDKIMKLTKVVYNFEIIGEASNHISDETKEKFPEVEWHLMRGMRNFISHVYFGVDLDSIWDTAIRYSKIKISN